MLAADLDDLLRQLRMILERNRVSPFSLERSQLPHLTPETRRLLASELPQPEWDRVDLALGAIHRGLEDLVFEAGDREEPLDRNRRGAVMLVAQAVSFGIQIFDELGRPRVFRERLSESARMMTSFKRWSERGGHDFAFDLGNLEAPNNASTADVDEAPDGSSSHDGIRG